MESIERLPGNSGNPAAFALVSGLSLLRVNWSVDVFKPVYDEVAQSERTEPLNRSEQVLPEFVRQAEERGATLPIDTLTTYWAPDTKYQPLEVFGTLVQFVDYHQRPLPQTTLPPEADVQRYIDDIMNRPDRATLSEQFALLLDITNNNLLGAANLGFIASRIMARGLETRAYPNIPSGAAEMRAWNKKIAQFELSGNSSKNDGPGDTYYFWTHMFGALYFNRYDGYGKRTFRKTFANGTEIMGMARQWIARSPTNAEHTEASHMGREIATAFEASIARRQAVRIGRIERILRHYPQLLHGLDSITPPLVKARARSYLRSEAFPLARPYTKKIGRVGADFWINNASDWHRIVQEDPADSFPLELIESIQPGDVFLDVGSAQGLYSILAAKAGAEVYAVDPDPVSVESIAKNLALNSDVSEAVHVLPLGLGDTSQTLTLNYDAQGVYAPSFRRTTQGLVNGVEVEVRVTDDLIDNGQIKTPDVIKIDVEGAEGIVIAGMRRLLTSAQPPRDLFVEIHDLYLPKFGNSRRAVLGQIASMGYVLKGGIAQERGKQMYHFVPQKARK